MSPGEWVGKYIAKAEALIELLGSTTADLSGDLILTAAATPCVGCSTSKIVLRLSSSPGSFPGTSEGARRAGGIEIFAETDMGKPPGVALGPPGFRRNEVAATGKEDDRPGR
jgi:hypothetical protein